MAKEKKCFQTPVGIFKVNSKAELTEFIKERYPDVKQKEIVALEKEPVGQQPRPNNLKVTRGRGLYLDSISIPESVPATKL